jgi:hypothetical protein
MIEIEHQTETVQPSRRGQRGVRPVQGAASRPTAA